MDKLEIIYYYCNNLTYQMFKNASEFVELKKFRGKFQNVLHKLLQ